VTALVENRMFVPVTHYDASVTSRLAKNVYNQLPHFKYFVLVFFSYNW